jgi:hypothetical protein
VEVCHNHTAPGQVQEAGGDGGQGIRPAHSLLTPVFLPQRVKYLLTPREPNRWAVEREGAVPFDSRKSMNGALMKPTHIVVETMM